MIRVLVAGSSAVVRSVLKEIILKTAKLEWVGEAASYGALKDGLSQQNPDIVISDKNLQLFIILQMQNLILLRRI